MANNENSPSFQWKRPESADYPKVWHTFKARDLNSDNLVEYRIQDLPLNRVDDLYKHLLMFFVPDEPTGLALGYQEDPYSTDDWTRLWQSIVAERTPIVCFKEGSNEIIGANVVYIKSKGDNFLENMMKEVSECSGRVYL